MKNLSQFNNITAKKIFWQRFVRRKFNTPTTKIDNSTQKFDANSTNTFDNSTKIRQKFGKNSAKILKKKIKQFNKKKDK